MRKVQPLALACTLQQVRTKYTLPCLPASRLPRGTSQTSDSMPAGHDARTPAGRNAASSRDRERSAPPPEVRADHPTPNTSAVPRHHPGHSTSEKPPPFTTCMHRTPPTGRPMTEPPPTDMTRDAHQHHPYNNPKPKSSRLSGWELRARLASLARSNPPSPFFLGSAPRNPDRDSNTAPLAFQSDLVTITLQNTFAMLQQAQK